MTRDEFLKKYGTETWVMLLEKYLDNADKLGIPGKVDLAHLLDDLKSVINPPVVEDDEFWRYCSCDVPTSTCPVHPKE